MPLARIFRLAGSARGTALQAQALADRPEPALAARAPRRRTATGSASAGTGRAATPAVFHSIEPAWNDRNLRELAGHVDLAAGLRAHPGARPAPPVQQTNCHPFRHGNWLFMHNGLIRDFHEVQARPRARGRPVALPGDRGLDRLRGALPPRAHVRAPGRPAGRGRARDGARRDGRAGARRRAPVSGDDRDDRRRVDLGVPLLERAPVALALLQHRRRAR